MMNATKIEAHLRSREMPGLPHGAGVLPDYAGFSICGIPGFVEALFGGRPEGSDALRPLLPDPLPQRVILLILDGMGYLHLRELLDRFPDLYLHKLIDGGAMIPLTSTVPATTTTAITSFTTGLTPQEHGMIGYRLYLRETSAITNMIRLSLHGNGASDAALAAGIDLERFLDVSTLPQRLAAAGVASHIFLSKSIAGSGLSRLLYGKGAAIHPVVNFADMLVAARETLQLAKGKSFVSLYWGATDTIAHVYGPWTDRFTAELRSIDAALERELDGQAEGALLLISADHGFVALEEDDYLSTPDYPDLAEGLLLPPVGDSRTAYLHVKDGWKDAVARFLADRFGEELVCLDSRAALAAGLFGSGEVKPEVPERIGDLVVLSTGRRSLYYPFSENGRLRGMHAGLTAQEMLVPFIVGRL